MRLEFDETDLAFRDEVRAFLDANLTDGFRQAATRVPSVFLEPEVAVAWQKCLHAKGWAASFWPKEHGGTGWSDRQRYIWEVECARARAPWLPFMGILFVGPVIFTFGTPEQKAFYLPRILSGEDYWCQGYSEPGAGSDLAGLQCKAVRDGDHYVINGTKIWTTHAHHANRIFALVRTSKEDRPQKGISFILIDMTLPGITVDPIITLAGDHEVNQVFFDDVRVPASDLIGEEGKGWNYAKFLLEYERGGRMYACRLEERIHDLRALAQVKEMGDGTALADDPDFARAVAAIESEVAALHFTELRNVDGLEGLLGEAMPSLVKTRGTEIEQAIDKLAVESLGYGALPYYQPLSPDYAPPNWFDMPEEAIGLPNRQLNGLAASIFGGTNEVQRSIIAKMLLS